MHKEWFETFFWFSRAQNKTNFEKYCSLVKGSQDQKFAEHNHYDYTRRDL